LPINTTDATDHPNRHTKAVHRSLPHSLPEAVRDLIRWAERIDVEPLPQDDVPGTSDSERRALSALGGLAGALTTARQRLKWPDALQSWVERSPEPTRDHVTALSKILDADNDPLAQIYERLVTGPNRRHLGTFFTPTPIVQHMIEVSARLLGLAPVTVVDPGAGVGAFTIAAQARWPKTHVHAVDVNVVTLGLLAARAAAHGDADRLTLLDRDYLAWSCEGLRSLKSTLVLGNPPYTRHQLMTAEQKSDAQLIVGDLVPSGLAGLSAYFMAATLRNLPKDAGLALLLPASWTEANYGREIREYLWRAMHRRVELHMFSSEIEVFPGTQVTAMILFVGPVRTKPMPFKLSSVVLSNDKVTVLKTIESVDRSGLPPRTWKRPSESQAPTSDSYTRRLGDFVTVRRGVATGANNFFFLTDEERDEWHLPEGALIRAIVKVAHVDTEVLDADAYTKMATCGYPRWLLNVQSSAMAEDPMVRAYLTHGVDQGFHMRHLTSVRDNWYAVEHVAPAEILLAPFGKPVHRVLRNHAGLVHSNSLYGLYLRPDSPYDADTLLNWLRRPDGQTALRDVARQYSGGSRKIEPRALLEVRVSTLDGGSDSPADLLPLG